MIVLKKSSDGLVAEVTQAVQNDLAKSLLPSIRKISEAASELEAAIGRAGGNRRRGRAGRRSGRPVAIERTTTASGYFQQNPHYVEYVRLLKDLHLLTSQGEGDSARADVIRDAMDIPWRHLTPREIARVRRLSADLYTRGQGRALQGAARTKRMPPGALKAAVRKVLAGAGGPHRLADVRDRVLKMKPFRGWDPKTTYAQVVHAVTSMTDVKKSEGRYMIKGESGAAHGRERRGRPSESAKGA